MSATFSQPCLARLHSKLELSGHGKQKREKSRQNKNSFGMPIRRRAPAVENKKPRTSPCFFCDLQTGEILTARPTRPAVREKHYTTRARSANIRFARFDQPVTTKFTAFGPLPFLSGSTSKLIRCPSFRPLSPACSTAVI